VVLDLISHLSAGARVLDLAARTGSFACDREDICIVRLDLEVPEPRLRRRGFYVGADAAHIPLASHSFDLVISNHSLEHFTELEPAVREVGRILKPGGALYVAVPDAGTVTDWIYRWIAKGGGHVNPFRSPEEVVALIERLTGLEHRGTKVLYSGLSFLNAHNVKGWGPKKSLLFAGGNEIFLAVFMWTLRRIDRSFGTRLSQYGWAFYFGSAEPENLEAWSNVCVRCGSGHSEDYLRHLGIVRRKFGFFESYRCPNCGAWNLLA
jgi:SAM-dependent methyltransferase